MAPCLGPVILCRAVPSKQQSSFGKMSSQICILLFLFVSGIVASDGGYGGGGQMFTGGFAGFQGGGGGGGGYGEAIGSPVQAAIATKRTFEVRPIMLQSEPPVPSVVDVQPSEQPVQVIFRTQSSPVLVQQVHTPSVHAPLEKTNSEDEPHRVLHEVVRPVIQEVREIIQPFRRVTQEVRPVVEEVHTVVAKGEKRQHGHMSPIGYQEQMGAKIITDEGQYGLALAGNELAAPVMASPPLNGHNLALATHGSELYLPDPRLAYRVAKLNKSRRLRVKASRRA